MTGRSIFCQLFALLALSCGVAGPALAADDAGKNSEMIVNGVPVEEGQIPWQVFLTRSWTDANGDSWVSWCGGSLIAPQWVLTAAHCLEEEGVAHKPEEMEVGYGSVHRSKLKTVKVEQVIPHAEYESKGSDIGLGQAEAADRHHQADRDRRARKSTRLLHAGNSNAAPTYIVSGWGRLLDIGDIDLATQLHQVNPAGGASDGRGDQLSRAAARGRPGRSRRAWLRRALQERRLWRSDQHHRRRAQYLRRRQGQARRFLPGRQRRPAGCQSSRASSCRSAS